MCISLESTEQRAVSFKRYSHKFLGKILHEGPQESLSGTAPLMSTHIYLMSCTRLFLPGFPPPFLHTASNEQLEVGTAWERG